MKKSRSKTTRRGLHAHLAAVGVYRHGIAKLVYLCAPDRLSFTAQLYGGDVSQNQITNTGWQIPAVAGGIGNVQLIREKDLSYLSGAHRQWDSKLGFDRTASRI